MRVKRLRQEKQQELASQEKKRETYTYRNYGFAATMGMWTRDIALAEKRVKELPEEIEKLTENIVSLEKHLQGNLQEEALLQLQNTKKEADAKMHRAEQIKQSLAEGTQGTEDMPLVPELLSADSLQSYGLR